MSPPRRRLAELTVGGFVLAALAVLLLAGFLVMRERRMFEGRCSYRAHFRDSYGIQPGNPVTLAGIEVGRVERIALDDEDRVEVTFSVLEGYASRLREDSLAEVKSPSGLGGIVGGTGLKISVGTRGKPPLAAGALVPSTDPFTFEDALALLKGSKVDERGERALHNVETLLASLGSPEGPVQSILRDTAALVHGVRSGESTAARRVDGTLRDLQHAMAGADQGIAALNRIFTKVETAAGEVEQATALAPEAARKVNALLDGFAAVLQTLGQALADIKRITARADGMSGDVARMVGQAERQMKDLDELMAALRKNFLVRPYIEPPKPPQAIDPPRADTGAAP